jgi:hypothetical protein
MATIKRAGNRIITKVVNGQRRVSCSCCPSEEGCCMYPAQGLTDGLYTVQDLPDELEMYYSDGVNFDGPTIVSHNGDGTYGEFNEVGSANPAAIAISFAGDEWITSYFQLDPSTDCLIKTLEADDPPSLSRTNVWVFDRFADTYKIEFNNVSDPASSEENGSAAFVVRRSLCVWSEDFEEDEPSGVKLLYRDFRNNRPRWQIQYSDDRAMGKAGPTGQLDGLLNTPEGSYGSSGGESAIISEA